MMSDEPEQRTYPEDERLRRLQEEPDRRMTRAEWEAEESRARKAAHERHEREGHEDHPDHRTQQQKEVPEDKRPQQTNWGKVALWVGLGLVVLLLIFFLGYLPRHHEQKKAAELARQRETEAPVVEVMQVKRSSAPGELTVPGTTAAITEAYLYARANGYLKKRLVDIGDHVKKGQLLAIIDAPDLDQQVDQARQQLNQAQAQVDQQQAQLALNKVTFERWRTLVAKGVFSRQDGDQREADYKAQLAVVASAERNVESYRANLGRVIALQSYERVTAPFNGVVTQRNVDVGALVGANGAGSPPPMQSSQSSTGGSANVGSSNTSGSSGMGSQNASPSTGQAQGGPLFAVAQYDKLRILVSVPEGYASSIHNHQQAQVFVQERNGKPIAAVVTRTANSIDANSRTMLVEVDLDNKDGSLYPGIYSVVSFVQVRGTAPIVIPGDAVAVRQDQTTVAIVQDNHVKLVPVEIGRDYGPALEILNGLQEGDWVITTVTDSVKPGIEVRTKINKDAAQQTGQERNATDKTPDFGPTEYGDQSIVNSQSESTNQKGKPGQGGKSGGKDGGKGGSEKSGGGKQSKDDSKGSSK